MPHCVEITHLTIGTRSDNAREASDRGLLPRGQYHYKAKLSADQVQQIRENLAAGQSSLSLAREYGVGEGTIHSIKSGKSWSWLTHDASRQPPTLGRKAGANRQRDIRPTTPTRDEFTDLSAILSAGAEDHANGCTLWRGRLNSSGYGVMAFRGRNCLRVHRAAMEVALKRRLRGNEHVLHSCDTRHCINVNHLRIGSHAENMEDLAMRERGTSILSAEDIRTIRVSLQPVSSLATQYGVARSTITDVIARRTWRWVK